MTAARSSDRVTLRLLKSCDELAWQDRASCRGMDPDLFFPARGEPVDEAKAACAACPVRDQCLEHALATGERQGVWGGTTGRERLRLHRRRTRQARGDRGA